MSNDARTELAYRPAGPTVTALGFVPSARRAPVVIGRDLCSFAWLDQREQKDRGARRREAELEGLRIASTPDASIYVVLWSAGAAVWTWDDAAVQQTLRQAERDELITVARAPETLMLAPAAMMLAPEDVAAAGLIACLNGVEGQVWKGGQLTGSRWWREAPNDREWSLFCTSLGLEPYPTPKVAPANVLRQPWKPNEYRPQNVDLIDRRAYFWGGALAVAGTLSLAAYATGVEMKYAGLNARVAALEGEAAPVRAANARVLRMASDYREVTEPMKGVQPLPLATDLAELIAQTGAKANEIDFRGDKVTITIPPDYLGQVEALLRLLETNPSFQGARLVDGAGAGGIRIEATVKAAS